MVSDLLVCAVLFTCNLLSSSAYVLEKATVNLTTRDSRTLSLQSMYASVIPPTLLLAHKVHFYDYTYYIEMISVSVGQGPKVYSSIISSFIKTRTP